MFLIIAALMPLKGYGQTENSPLRALPLAYRNDGFSHYCLVKPPLDLAKFQKNFIDPIVDGNIQIMEWGIGPGSVFCYDTKVGEMFGANVTDEQWKQLRDVDRRVYDNLTSLLASGVDPLKAAVDYGHEKGMKVFARLEMQHEYGPVTSWKWIAFVGKFNKDHPEHRIPGSVFLDFKHKAVRDFKLAILREAVERGFDGLSLDFVVSPFYFEEPNKYRPLMTRFIRDVRNMLDEVGRTRNQRLELMIRVTFDDSYERGLDWKACMREKLIDYIVPFKGWPVGDYFNMPVDEFVAYRDKVNSQCKVYGCVWQSLGLVDTDPSPKGKKRFSKPKVKEMYFAQAALHNLAGADGLQLAFASASQWRPFYADLGTPSKVEFADKQYMVDVKPYMPIIFRPSNKGVSKSQKSFTLDIADDINRAVKAGYQVDAQIVLYSRSLEPKETLTLSINDNKPIIINARTLGQQNESSAVSTTDITKNRSHTAQNEKSFLNDPHWWKRGQKAIPINPTELKCGQNTFHIEYSGHSDAESQTPDLEIVWIDLVIKYRR